MRKSSGESRRERGRETKRPLNGTILRPDANFPRGPAIPEQPEDIRGWQFFRRREETAGRHRARPALGRVRKQSSMQKQMGDEGLEPPSLSV